MFINSSDDFLQTSISAYKFCPSSPTLKTWATYVRKGEEEKAKDEEAYVKSINQFFKLISNNKVFVKITNTRSTRNNSIGYINSKKTKLPHFDSYYDYIVWREKAKFIISFDGEKDLPVISVYNFSLISGEQDDLKTNYVLKIKQEPKKIPDKVDSIDKVIKLGQACIASCKNELKYGFVTKITKSKVIYVTYIGENSFNKISSPETKLIVFNNDEDMYKKIVKLKILKK